MKYIIATIGIMVLLACGADSYTSGAYFDSQKVEFTQESDTQQLIYAFLEKVFIADQQPPLRTILKDKKKVYIGRTYYSQFSAPTKNEIIIHQFQDNDIPSSIGDTRFSLKTETELLNIADKTSGFVYYVIGNIEINGVAATIGIDGRWQNQTTTHLMGIGEGREMHFKKVDGKWIYEKKAEKMWIS